MVEIQWLMFVESFPMVCEALLDPRHANRNEKGCLCVSSLRLWRVEPGPLPSPTPRAMSARWSGLHKC